MRLRLEISLLVWMIASCVCVHAQSGRDSIRSERLREVNINANAPQKVFYGPAAIQQITARQIKQLPTLQLSDALKYMSGVVVRDYGGVGGMKTVSVRGLGEAAQHTEVVINRDTGLRLGHRTYITRDPVLLGDVQIMHNVELMENVRCKHGGNLTERCMDLVGIEDRLRVAYPHEMDGGRRQRVGIARALALRPSFIMCDEPVSALDVSIQAQVLNLLMDLQEKMGLTYMFVTHDLSVVRHISDDISVMYLGQMVETSPTKDIFDNPLHPYTKALLSAIPSIDLDNPM